MTDSAHSGPLKRSSVFLVLLLSLLTGGVYTRVWYLRPRRRLNLLDSTSTLGVAGPVLLIAFSAIYLALPPDSAYETVASVAVGVTNLAMALSVRWMIVDHLRTRRGDSCSSMTERTQDQGPVTPDVDDPLIPIVSDDT